MINQENEQERFIEQYKRIEVTMSSKSNVSQQALRFLLVFGIIARLLDTLGFDDPYISAFIRKNSVTSPKYHFSLQNLAAHFSFCFNPEDILYEDLAHPQIPSDVLLSLQSLLSKWQWRVDEFDKEGNQKVLSPAILARIAEHLSPMDISMGAVYTPPKTAMKMSIQSFFAYLGIDLPDNHSSTIDSSLRRYFQHTYSQSPEELVRKIMNLQIVDNSVGSGSFLIAYAYCLSHFLDEVDKQVLVEGKFLNEWKGDTTQSFEYQKRYYIVSKLLFGVDKDPFAVEICRLRLKFFIWAILEQNFKKKNISDINTNIRVGNSLFGLDLAQRSLYSDVSYKTQRKKQELQNQVFLNFLESIDIECTSEELQQIKPFHWQIEFPQVTPGFDISIGNPPFISLKGKFRKNVVEECERKYYRKVLKIDTYRPNLFEAFVYRSLLLLKEGGVLCYIVPDRLATNRQFTRLRQKLLTYELLHLEFGVHFEDVVGNAMILTLRKETPTKEYVKVTPSPKEGAKLLNRAIFKRRKGHELLFVPEQITKLFEPILSSPNCHFLESYFQTGVGFIARAGTIHTTRESPLEKEVIKGEDIFPFQITKVHWFDFSKKNLVGGTQDLRKLTRSPKILLRKTGDSLICCYDPDGVIPEQSLYFIYSKDHSPKMSYFLLGILSSTVINCYYCYYSTTNRESMPQLKKMDLDRFPLILIPEFITEIARWTFFRYTLQFHPIRQKQMLDFVEEVNNCLVFQNYFLPQDLNLVNSLNQVYKKAETRTDNFNTDSDTVYNFVKLIQNCVKIQKILQRIKSEPNFKLMVTTASS